MSENKIFEGAINKRELAHERIENGLRLIMRGKMEIEMEEANMALVLSAKKEHLSDELKGEIDRIAEIFKNKIDVIREKIEEIAQVITELAQSMDIEIDLQEIINSDDTSGERKEAA